MSDLSTFDLVLRVVRQGLLIVLLVSAPPLLVSLVVGLVVGVLQAATQVSDHSLGFVPKLLAVVVVLLAVGPWLGAHVARFAQAVFLVAGSVR